MKGVIKMAIRFLSMPIKEKSTLESRKFGQKTIMKKAESKSLLEEHMYCSIEGKKMGKDFKNEKSRKVD